ncbi:MAG: FAD-dependent oxidoreductase, partial [Candidatus Margulisbacteria bacterium]|nr:FAD-dependent oxidoreductase [Candidatus Margulisiibacteriota bacterium]
EKMPESLLIAGGGPTGLEISQVYARFGCKVTVLEISERLLPEKDPELGPIMEKALSEEGIDLILGCEIKKFYNKEGKKAALVSLQGTEKEVMADQILIAAGRIPSIATLDLKLARVKYSKKGITVDEHLRTTSPNIWACGDAIGPYQSVHAAAYQAGIVVANMVFRWPKKANYDLLPFCVFTDPEVATLGLTEKTAKEKGIRFETARFDFKDLDRAICDDSEIGFLKLLIRKGKIIGATCVGSDAGNIIPELILAASAKLSLSKISKAIHIYPTLAQINLQAVNKYLSNKQPGPFSKKLARFMFNLFN